MSGARALLLVYLGACAPPADPAGPREHPSAGAAAEAGGLPEAGGPVLRVDDVEVRAEEVLAIALAVGEVHPEYTEIHRRRVALTQVVLPRAALRAHAGAARGEALRRAGAALEALAAGAEPGSAAVPPAVGMSGDWRVLGIALWSAARGLVPDVWSGPFEFAGSVALLRLTGTDDQLPPPPSALLPAERSLTLEVVDFPYLSPGGRPSQVLEEAIAGATLTIVDPTWAEAVPESWKYRMRGQERER